MSGNRPWYSSTSTTPCSRPPARWRKASRARRPRWTCRVSQTASWTRSSTRSSRGCSPPPTSFRSPRAAWRRIRPRHASLHRRRNLLAWGVMLRPTGYAIEAGTGEWSRFSRAFRSDCRHCARPRWRSARNSATHSAAGSWKKKLAPLRGDQAQRVRRRSARRGAGRSAVPAHGGRHAFTPTATTSPSCQRGWPSVQPFRNGCAATVRSTASGRSGLRRQHHRSGVHGSLPHVGDTGAQPACGWVTGTIHG